MSYVSPKTHFLLTEAARTELSITENVTVDDVSSTYESAYRHIPALPDGIVVYSEETVPVFALEEGSRRAVVEEDTLAKFMGHNNITDVLDALDRLKEYYQLESLDIVIESESEAAETLEEAKKMKAGGSSAGLKKIKATTKTMDTLKKKGVKLWKNLKRKVS
jgi:hypothetical protein